MLKAVYESETDIPEAHRELFEEKDGKFFIKKIEGMKTDADVQRVQRALEQEKTAHKETKERLTKFGDLDADEIHGKLDEFEELKVRLETGEGGKIDEEKIEKLVEQRVRRQVAPFERENSKLKNELAERDSQLGELQGTITKSRIETSVRKQAEALKIVPSAIDDVVMLAERICEVSDDGAVVTKDGVGVLPGVGLDVWLSDMKPKRPHWWPTSQGGGAGGSEGNAGVGNNPWSKDHWNLTAQGKIVQEQGLDKAQQFAKAAGSKVGATKPAG